MIELDSFQEAVNMFAKIWSIAFLIPFSKSAEDNAVVIGCSWFNLCCQAVGPDIRQEVVDGTAGEEQGESNCCCNEGVPCAAFVAEQVGCQKQ